MVKSCEVEEEFAQKAEMSHEKYKCLSDREKGNTIICTSSLILQRNFK